MRKSEKSSSSSSSSGGSDSDSRGGCDKELDDGFYEIQTIRRKRLRKGQLQYLIKWRGWPETANTWEPLQNLQSVPDLIHAFEESLKSGSGSGSIGGGGGRKRKRTTDPIPSSSSSSLPLQQPSNQQQQQQPLNAQSNCNKGAKRRKSSSVKRFNKQQEESESAVAVDVDDVTNNQIAISVGKVQQAGYVGNYDNAKTACTKIIKILKPIGYSASLSCYMHDVSVTFMALRSDGTEVMVDNKYLKTYNPLLLINFYEQHLRYNPTS